MYDGTTGVIPQCEHSLRAIRSDVIGLNGKDGVSGTTSLIVEKRFKMLRGTDYMTH